MTDKNTNPSINVKVNLYDLKGDIVVMAEPTGEKDETGKPVFVDKKMRLGDVLVFALLAQGQQDTAKLKTERFSAAMKISNVLIQMGDSGEIELNLNELKTCVDAAGEHLTTLFYGRVLQILDPNQVK